MAHRLPTINGRSSTRGFTIVECLIGLTISVILLTAVAMAFNASVINYRENEEMYQSINIARQALMRMTSQLRTAGYEVAPGVWGGVDPLAPANQCNFWTSTGEDITYEFRSADGKLYLITNANGNEYVLCDNVVGATFTKVPTDTLMDCKSVEISLTVRCGDFERTLSAASAIRKNLPF